MRRKTVYPHRRRRRSSTGSNTTRRFLLRRRCAGLTALTRSQQVPYRCPVAASRETSHAERVRIGWWAESTGPGKRIR